MKPLDAAVVEILDQMAAFGAPPTESLTPAQARNLPALDYVLRELVARHGARRVQEVFSPSPEAVGGISHRVIEGPDGEPLLGRVYMPSSGRAPYPVVLFFHGGGFVLGDLNSHDATPRALCEASGAIVVSVAYRLAPEAPFPAAVEDAFAAYRWLLENAGELGGDPARIAVAGESAGGNLAAVVSLLARDQGLRMPAHQLLIYPVTDWSREHASYVENAEARPLNSARMRWFKRHYLRKVSDADEWRASPLLAPSHAGLPPATVITAENDPLRDEGRAYAAALREAGVPVSYHHFEGVPHVFFSMIGLVPQAREALKLSAEALQASFLSRAS